MYIWYVSVCLCTTNRSSDLQWWWWLSWLAPGEILALRGPKYQQRTLCQWGDLAVREGGLYSCKSPWTTSWSWNFPLWKNSHLDEWNTTCRGRIHIKCTLYTQIVEYLLTTHNCVFSTYNVHTYIHSYHITAHEHRVHVPLIVILISNCTNAPSTVLL